MDFGTRIAPLISSGNEKRAVLACIKEHLLYRRLHTALSLTFGQTDAEMAAFFRVVERAIANWKVAHPEFFQSITRRAG